MSATLTPLDPADAVAQMSADCPTFVAAPDGRPDQAAEFVADIIAMFVPEMRGTSWAPPDTPVVEMFWAHDDNDCVGRLYARPSPLKLPDEAPADAIVWMLDGDEWAAFEVAQ